MHHKVRKKEVDNNTRDCSFMLSFSDYNRASIFFLKKNKIIIRINYHFKRLQTRLTITVMYIVKIYFILYFSYYYFYTFE